MKWKRLNVSKSGFGHHLRLMYALNFKKTIEIGTQGTTSNKHSLPAQPKKVEKTAWLYSTMINAKKRPHKQQEREPEGLPQDNFPPWNQVLWSTNLTLEPHTKKRIHHHLRFIYTLNVDKARIDCYNAIISIIRCRLSVLPTLNGR